MGTSCSQCIWAELSCTRLADFLPPWQQTGCDGDCRATLNRTNRCNPAQDYQMQPCPGLSVRCNPAQDYQPGATLPRTIRSQRSPLAKSVVSQNIALHAAPADGASNYLVCWFCFACRIHSTSCCPARVLRPPTMECVLWFLGSQFAFRAFFSCAVSALYENGD